MFSAESLELLNRDYASSTDSDYELPDYVQKKSLHETCELTRSTPNQLEMEEKMRRIFESKINRYPLRHCVKVGTSSDIQSRPNYYESDQEEEEEKEKEHRPMRRRHSIAASLDQEEEEENGEANNLCRNIRKRRYSEGSIGSLLKDENFSELNSRGGKSADSQGSVCITRTVTYKSKKQIVKFYQTKNLILNPSQSEIVRKRLTGNNSTPESQQEITNIVDKICRGTIPKNEPLKEIKGVRRRRKLLDCQKGTPKKSPFLQNEKHAIQNKMDLQRPNVDAKECTVKNNKNRKSYFLGQLGLQTQCNSKGKIRKKKADKNTASTCTMKTSDKKDEKTQTSSENSASLLEKLKKNEGGEAFSKISEKKKPGENTRVRIDNKTEEEKALNVKPNVEINLQLKNDRKINNSNKYSLRKKNKEKYLAIVKKDCENLFQPDSLLRKDSLGKTVTKESRDNAKTTYASEIPEKILKTKEAQTKEGPHKNKVTWHKETGKINIPEIVIPKENQKIYNIEELECKLKSLFEEPLNKSLLERTAEKIKEKTAGCDLNTKNKKIVHVEKNTDPHPNNGKDKPSRYCAIHRKKGRELERVKHPSIEILHLHKSTDKTKQNPPVFADVEIEKRKKRIAVLREKRRMLVKIKSALEKTWCTKVCSKNSCLKLKMYRRKTKVERESIAGPSKPNDVEEGDSLLRQSNVMLQNDNMEISENNSKNVKTSVDDTEQAKSNEEETIEEKFKDLLIASEKNASDRLEIVQDCICCSPRTRMAESSNDFQTENHDLRSEHSPKVPRESETLGVISLSENSMTEGMDSEKWTVYIDCCVCCMSLPVSEKKNCTDQDNLDTKEIISKYTTDDVADENSTSISDENNAKTKTCSPPEDNATKADRNVVDSSKTTPNAEQVGDATCTEENSARTQISQESWFFEEAKDRDLQNLIRALTDNSDTSPLSPEESQTENECVTKGSTTANLTTDDAQLSMTGMEHYKKRLIHQHEKPGTASSPCTTTEEEDDSLESPLSPASSVQSRDSGSRLMRKEEVVQKVARKRAVCRSQFRHQNMELFKLGSSIPTSLCKTKEPYNVCAEKNLQLCYQNGSSKNCDKKSAKGSLTESILNTIDGGKKRDVPLWRSISLTNEMENKNLNSNNGRHILPAIVPELPEHRRSRIKSLPENTSKNVTDNAKAQRINNGPGNVYDFVEEKEETNTHKSQHAVDKDDMATMHRNKNITSRRQSTSSTQTPEAIKAQSVDTPTTRQSTVTNTKPQSKNVTEVPYIPKGSSTEVHEVMEASGRNVNVASIMPSSEIQGIVPAHSQNAVRRSISAESDANDCVPINLSLRNKEDANSRHSWPGLASAADYRKRSEVNKNQHPTNAIPRQPSNVPKKPQQDVVANALNENIASAIASEGAHVDKDGNCFFVTSIPGSALDPHKQSNVIVINFPHVQQQMARMEKPPLDMLDSAIMSLVNIVKSSVESVFNVMSLPVLNRLYIDLNRYLVLPAVSVKMKMCIEEALNSLIIYLLANLLRTPCTSKARDFVHKMLLLDLRPHMDFLINSLGLIQQKIKYDYFMDELLKILSHSPQENRFRAPRQHFSMQQLPLDYRDYRRNNLWMENYGYEAAPPYELMPGISPQKRGRRPIQEGQNSLPMDVRVPENFSAPNLTLMRPDSYLADNRCIPPNNPPVLPEQFYMHSLNQPRPKGRPRNLSKINKIAATKPGEPLTLLPVHDQILHRRLTTENPTPVTSRNLDPRRRSVDSINPEVNRRSSEITLHRETIEEKTQKPAARGTVENTGNVFDYNVRQEMNEKQLNGGTVPIPAPPSDTTMDLSIKKAHRNDVPSFKNVEAPLKPHNGGKAVIIGNEVVQRREQREDWNPRNPVPVNDPIRTTSEREKVPKQFPAPDVEQYLQTNIIVNKNQRNPANQTSVIVNDDKKISEKLVGSEAIEEAAQRSEREASEASKKDGISSTVIIKDKSMVVSKGGASSLHDRTQSNSMDLDDVVLERVSPNVNSKSGISCTTSRIQRQKTDENTEDVSIEKVNDAPPKLIKLTSLKRRLTLDEKWQKKPKAFNSDEVVVIDDDEEPELDCNQNDVTKPNVDSETTSIKKQEDDEKPAIEDISSEEEVLESFRLYSTYENKLAGDPGKILQTTEASHCTLIPGNVKAVQDANWHLFEKTPVYTRPVLPRKLRRLSLDVDPAPRREPLANLVRFEEDRDSFACTLSLSNSEHKYPTSMDAMLFSPPEGRSRTPSFKSPPRLIPVVHTSPNLPLAPVVQTSPRASRPAVVQTSPQPLGPTVAQTSPVPMPNSPFAMGPPVTPTPPRISGLPVVQTSPVSFMMGPPVVRASPRVADQPVVQTSPVPVSPLNESEVNWGHWFSEEQRKGVFDFDTARRKSTETPTSDYSPGFEPYCEIKVDSKTCRIKRSLLERIPKGKLCYVRESNTFVRYFDNSQMELFISNLNLGEGSTAAQELLKQVRGRADAPADVETPPGQGEPSPQGEVTTLAKDVVFSTEDFLSDPELYVEEVEKVQRYAPKDFYGFYKFVTGYQIVNHHPPISFQTFLTMHNTNGIRGLFKNYVNTLVEGRTVL